jgi:hypothetical protein
MKTTFEADDGSTFYTAADCREYEQQLAMIDLLIGRTEEQVRNALARLDIPLANAIERAGNIIADKRRESGELRRKKKKDGKTDTGAAMDDIKKQMKAIS